MSDFSDIRWWEADARSAAERVWDALQACEHDDKSRHADILHRVRMYGNRAYAGIASGNYNRTTSKRRGRLNIVKDCCDTAINRLLGNKPKPTPLPISGSNWSLRRRAKLLDRFLQGQFRVSQARQRMMQALSDAVIAGDGLVKVTEDGTSICLERTFAGDLSVPPLEARAGTPRTLYQHHFVDREVLLAKFEDNAAAQKTIREAERTDSRDDWYNTTLDPRADQLEVVEGWRLPSVRGGDDGCHIVTVRGGTLRKEKWAHDYFPFVKISWETPYLGYWSDSMVDVVEGQQIEINRLVKKVARGNDIAGHVVIFHEVGQNTKINFKKLTNEPLCQVPYMGERPTLETIEAVSPKVFGQIQDLKLEARELAGLYQAGTEGVPRALESGEAISRWNDLGAKRFRRFAEAFEQAHVELARQLIDRARDLSKKNPKFAVPAAKDRYSLEHLDWSEVDMEEDQYVLAVYPSSSLPDDPAGRVAAVETMVRAGMIPPDRGAHLLNFPDLEGGFLALDRASYEATERQIEIMLDEGVQQVPEPFQDLELALKLGQSHYLNAHAQGVPEDRLKLVRTYLSGVQALLQKRQLEQQRMAMQAGQASGGVRSPAAGAPPAQGVAGVSPTAVGGADARVA